jgi:hypothetical protein
LTGVVDSFGEQFEFRLLGQFCVIRTVEQLSDCGLVVSGVLTQIEVGGVQAKNVDLVAQLLKFTTNEQRPPALLQTLTDCVQGFLERLDRKRRLVVGVFRHEHRPGGETARLLREAFAQPAQQQAVWLVGVTRAELFHVLGQVAAFLDEASHRRGNAVAQVGNREVVQQVIHAVVHLFDRRAPV